MQGWIDEANEQARNSPSKKSPGKLKAEANSNGDDWAKAHPNGPVPSSPHSASSLEISSGHVQRNVVRVFVFS